MKMKQILAGVLTAAMVLTCAPTTTLAATDSSANAVDTTLQPGANIVRDEVIFIPNEDGTFPEVDSTTNPEVMEYLNGLSSIVVTVAYKYTDTAQLKPSTYSLFSMEGENGRHFTIRTSPQRSNNTANSDFTYAYTNSQASLKWGATAIPQDTKWHKYSLSITKKPYSDTDTNGYNTVVVDGIQVITNDWNMSGNHYPEGHLCGDNQYTKVHIGKRPDDTSRLTNVGETWEDFPGKIAFVTVSSASMKKAELEVYNRTLQSNTLKRWEEAKAKYTELTAGNSYTQESFHPFHEKLESQIETGWEMYNAIDELEELYNALVPSTEDSKIGAVASLQETYDAVTPYYEHGDMYTAGAFDAFAEQYESAGDMLAHPDNYRERDILNAMRGLKALTPTLIREYTDVAVGTDVYDANDPAAVKFFSNMSGLTFSVVFKYNALPQVQYNPLITFVADNGQYVTIYVGVNDANGKVAFSYPTSSANGFTANAVKINDTTQYHKLSFSFKDSNIYMKLDDAAVGTILDSARPTDRQPVSWGGKLVEVLNDNVFTKVLIGKKYESDAFDDAGYSSTFPDSTIKSVQISRVANDGDGLTTLHTHVSAGVRNEWDAAVNELVSEREEMLANGVSAYYTDASWTEYNNACTTAAAATKEWGMMNKVATARTAKANLVKKSPQFRGYNITLGGKIGVAFHTDVAFDNSTKRAEIKVGDQVLADDQIELVNDTTLDKRIYKINLPAKQMTDDITVDILENDVVVDRAVCSVADYAQTLLDDPDSTEEMKDLVKAMLNYGAAAQTQFDYNTANPANANLTETDKVVPEIGTALDTACQGMGVTAAGTAAGYKGISLVLTTETALKLYAATDGGIVLKKDGTQVAASSEEKNNGFAFAKVENIAANHLQDTYTVEIGGTEVGTVSPLLYCYNVTKGSFDQSLKNLVNALYAYNQKAITYSESLETTTP